MTKKPLYYATLLHDNIYAVRPTGQLGTCGYYPYAWTVQYIKAKSPQQAIQKKERQA